MPSSARSSPAPAAERGQAAVEVALVVPLVALLLLAIVQVGLVVRDQVLVVHAAREAARAAAVDPRPGAADLAAKRSSALKPDRVTTETVTSHFGGVSDTVTVQVAYRTPTDVPLIGPLLPDIVLRAEAAMRVEY